jgi:hypothetical protein
MLVPRRSERRIDPNATAIVPYEVDLAAAFWAGRQKAAALFVTPVARIIVDF